MTQFCLSNPNFRFCPGSEILIFFRSFGGTGSPSIFLRRTEEILLARRRIGFKIGPQNGINLQNAPVRGGIYEFDAICLKAILMMWRQYTLVWKHSAFNFTHCFTLCNLLIGLPIDGGYSQWSTWSPCSRTCGLGSQKRNRSCTSPRPQSGGRDCSTLGRATESKMCNTQRCPGEDA